MELHGGTVEGASSGVGRGSTFTLKFPISALRTTRDSIGPIDGAAWLREVRVLVVEGDPDSRDLIVALLTSNGAKVTVV
jgi:hypothetical protein